MSFVFFGCIRVRRTTLVSVPVAGKAIGGRYLLWRQRLAQLDDLLAAPAPDRQESASTPAERCC